MTGLMILTVILLIVIVFWMIVITTLYYSLFRGMKSLRKAYEDVMPVQNEAIRTIIEEMDSYISLTEMIKEQAIECYATAKAFMKHAAENKDIAMKTIHSSRLMQKEFEELRNQMQSTLEESRAYMHADAEPVLRAETEQIQEESDTEEDRDEDECDANCG